MPEIGKELVFVLDVVGVDIDAAVRAQRCVAAGSRPLTQRVETTDVALVGVGDSKGASLSPLPGDADLEVERLEISRTVGTQRGAASSQCGLEIRDDIGGVLNAD